MPNSKERGYGPIMFAVLFVAQQIATARRIDLHPPQMAATVVAVARYHLFEFWLALFVGIGGWIIQHYTRLSPYPYFCLVFCALWAFQRLMKYVIQSGGVETELEANKICLLVRLLLSLGGVCIMCTVGALCAMTWIALILVLAVPVYLIVMVALISVWWVQTIDPKWSGPWLQIGVMRKDS